MVVVVERSLEEVGVGEVGNLMVEEAVVVGNHSVVVVRVRFLLVVEGSLAAVVEVVGDILMVVEVVVVGSHLLVEPVEERQHRPDQQGEEA